MYFASTAGRLWKPFYWLMLFLLGCGGSMVVHQAVKPAVPGSNPASLQPAGTCQGWYDNCRLASEGRQRQKKYKNTKKIIRKNKFFGPS